MSNGMITVEPLNTKVANEYESRSRDISAQVKSLVIKNQEQYENADGIARSIKAMMKDMDVSRKKITSPLDAAKKAVMDLFRPMETALENNLRHVDSLLIAYSQQKERERREQEEKLRRQAEAEEARKRKEKEEQERKWREKEEAKRKEAEALAKQGREEEARKAQEAADRAALEAERRREQAAEVRVEAPVLAPTVQAPTGTSYRTDWYAEVTDLRTLVMAVAAGVAPLDFLEANLTVINKQATATKDSLVFPGVVFKSKQVPVRR